MPSSEVLLALGTLALALFTAALVVVSVLQWRTFNATRADSIATERAYVGLSHTSPPGLALSAGVTPTAAVNIEVKNNGRTPANVTSISLGLRIEPAQAQLPRIPPYDPAKQITAFLTTGDTFFIDPSPWTIPPGDFAQVQAGTEKLYLLGYVDYKDQFGKRHRHGYARVYDAGNPGNNLVFVTQADYNYDRPL
jgi:hypothetical protein